jgi:hypothetical protein
MSNCTHPPTQQGGTVATTDTTATNETIAYLEAHGFTHDPGSNWYDHDRGYARVELIDTEAACFTVYTFTHDRALVVTWQVQLYHAPLAVFGATVSAAIA